MENKIKSFNLRLKKEIREKLALYEQWNTQM